MGAVPQRAPDGDVPQRRSEIQAGLATLAADERERVIDTVLVYLGCGCSASAPVLMSPSQPKLWQSCWLSAGTAGGALIRTVRSARSDPLT
ncbi:hypothetical protein DYI20_01915 [Auritidibacter ignavus]|nr:hypothetical protein DCC25_08165 [Auritidibacter sp. NML120636]PXA82363.1 hypothetical protein DCC26_00960 [Auritidibacter sp. NML120779]RMX23913.1 hypothetical protein DYI20_01915 [Auritidibacter ignavus]